MNRPITIFTGQWADLPFEEACRVFSSMGYDGVEICSWGDHLDVQKAAEDHDYAKKKRAILHDNGLGCWAISAHLLGQCIGDKWDKRLDGFAPENLAGKPEKIRAWGIEQMMYAPRAAKAMGCTVVTGFMGSPIWKYLYSFPMTPEEMVEEGFQLIYELWSPIFDEYDKQGVTFALEVHPTEIAFDYWTTKRLLEKFDNRPALGLNFDPSHLIWQGIQPHLFLRDFADRIYHVHMKDAALTLDGRSGILGSHLPFGDLRRGWNFRSLGHGDVNFEEIMRVLNDMDYQGPLSVEWEDNGMDRMFGAKESCEFVKKYNFTKSHLNFDGAMENQ